MSKVSTVLTFTLVLPIAFILLFFSLQSLSTKKGAFPPLSYSASKTGIYGALPAIPEATTQKIEQKDARVELVRQFFGKYKSPLEPYAQKVVESADTYGLDFRLIPAIAMQESNLCKRVPKDSYNCWGFGIYGSKIKRFSGYPEAIEAVTKTLALTYKSDGLHTTEDIMTRYTPTSNGSWANAVIHFMSELQ